MEVASPADYFPQDSYLSFVQQPKFEALTKKMKEFNEKIPEDDKLESESIERLHRICSRGKGIHAARVYDIVLTRLNPFVIFRARLHQRGSSQFNEGSPVAG